MLDYSSSREKVLNGFLYSPEFSAQCATAGIYIGEPIYEPDTGHAWKNNVTLLTLVNNVREQQGKPKLHLREDLWADVAMIRTSEIIARYTELLCPAVRPYILHVQPLLLKADCSLPGGLIAGLGMDIAEASLYMLNNMRTFTESKVPIASDGPGAERQQK